MALGINNSFGSPGTVFNFSFTNANGFTGVVTSPTTSPNLTLSISDSRITSALLTGYVVGANTAIAASDSILSAFEKVQSQINAINLTGNVYKIAYYEEVSATSGTITIPTGSTILLNQLPAGADALVSKVNVKPTGENPTTAGGAQVDVSSFDALGNYSLNGTPSAYPVAIIFWLAVPADQYDNLNIQNILEEEIGYSQQVRDTLLTGYVSGSNTPITSANSVLTAFQDLQAQITAGGGGPTGSGTANFGTKWTGTTTLGNSLYQDNGTETSIGVSPVSGTRFNIQGVGTTSATFGIKVQNSSGTNNAFLVRNDGFSSMGSAVVTSTRFNIQSSGTSTTTFALKLDNSTPNPIAYFRSDRRMSLGTSTFASNTAFTLDANATSVGMNISNFTTDGLYISSSANSTRGFESSMTGDSSISALLYSAGLDSYGMFMEMTGTGTGGAGVWIDNQSSGSPSIHCVSPGVGSNYFMIDSNSAIVYQDGTQGVGKFLTSDANGLASWGSALAPVSLSANFMLYSTGTGTFTGTANANLDSGGSISINGDLTLADSNKIIRLGLDQIIDYNAGSGELRIGDCINLTHDLTLYGTAATFFLDTKSLIAWGDDGFHVYSGDGSLTYMSASSTNVIAYNNLIVGDGTAADRSLTFSSSANDGKLTWKESQGTLNLTRNSVAYFEYPTWNALFTVNEESGLGSAFTAWLKPTTAASYYSAFFGGMQDSGGSAVSTAYAVGLTGYNYINGTNTRTHTFLCGGENTTEFGSSANNLTVTELIGTHTLAGSKFGGAGTVTVTTAYGIKIDNVSGFTPTTHYGLYISAISTGTTKYAIYTNAGDIRFGGNVTLADVNLVLGTTTGTKIGTATTQKIGFWNATPIVQPTTAVAGATFTVSAGTAVNDASTFDGYTIKQVVKALRNEGLLA